MNKQINVNINIMIKIQEFKLKMELNAWFKPTVMDVSYNQSQNSIDIYIFFIGQNKAIHLIYYYFYNIVFIYIFILQYIFFV